MTYKIKFKKYMYMGRCFSGVGEVNGFTNGFSKNWTPDAQHLVFWKKLT